jgi:ribosomal protein L17
VVGCRSTLKQARELQPFLSKLVSIAEKHDGVKATTLALVPPRSSKTKKAKSKAKANDVVFISDRKQLEKLVSELIA